MCKNAQIFNEPGSIIYKDARVILRTVKQKNFELMAAQKARENRGTRSRSRGPGKKQYASEVSRYNHILPSFDEIYLLSISRYLAR